MDDAGKQLVAEFLASRNLNPRTADLYRIEGDAEHKLLKIDLLDREGERRGNLLRSLDPATSWRYRNEPGSKTQDLLYGEWQVQATRNDFSQELWVVEGVADVWALRTLGVRRAVALMGSYHSEASQEKLRRAACWCVERNWTLTLWAASERGLDGVRRTLARLHRQALQDPELRKLRTALFVSGWHNYADESKSWGSPAALLSASPTDAATTLHETRLFDGVTGEAYAGVTAAEGDELALRRLREALSHAPFAPESYDLMAAVSHANPHMAMNLAVTRPAKGFAAQFGSFIEDTLSRQAGGNGSEELRVWIEEHGSPALKHASAKGYNIEQLALNERAGEELGEGAYVDALDMEMRQLQVGARNHPSRAAIERELELSERLQLDPERLRIRYISQAPADCPRGEVIELRGYLDRYTVYLPVDSTAVAVG